VKQEQSSRNMKVFFSHVIKTLTSTKKTSENDKTTRNTIDDF